MCSRSYCAASKSLWFTGASTTDACPVRLRATEYLYFISNPLGVAYDQRKGVDVLLANWRVFPEGLLVTLEVGIEAIAIGTVLGTLIGLGLTYGITPMRLVLRVYVDLLRGLPLLVTIFIIFYGVPAAGLPMPSKTSVVLALGIFASAHMAEIVRGAVTSIPRGQTEAAKAIGLTYWKRMRFVILPQATRRALPAWVNLDVEILKGTALVSLVGVADLLLSVRHALERTQQPIPFYIALAVIYFLMCYGLSRVGNRLERHFAYGT